MITIDPASGLVTFINVFKCAPENQTRLLELLTEVLQRAFVHLSGARSASLHRSLDGKSVVNYAQWESVEAWRQHAQTAQRAAALLEEIARISTSDPGLYEVAFQLDNSEAGRSDG